MITITRLTLHDLPWRYSLRITNIDKATFHKFVDALKMFIGHRNRKWSDADRCWLLRDADNAIALIQQFGLDYECEDTEPEPPRPQALTTTEAYETLFLRPGAPDFLVHAVYKALAKKWHPDAGGSTTVMQQLNRAMEVLK